MSNPLLIGFATYGIISEFIGIVDLICIIRFYFDKKYAAKKPKLWLEFKAQETFLFLTLVWLPVKIVSMITSWIKES